MGHGGMGANARSRLPGSRVIELWRAALSDACDNDNVPSGQTWGRSCGPGAVKSPIRLAGWSMRANASDWQIALLGGETDHGACRTVSMGSVPPIRTGRQGRRVWYPRRDSNP